jgi:hypothetical protein
MNAEPSIVESLYQEDLYQIPGKFLIIIPKEWNLIAESEVTQLTKILAALKLNLSSVQVITKDLATIEALSSFSPARIVSFGVPFEPAIKPYENTEHNGIKIICADTLDALDDIKKRNLWLALKAMFGV